MFPDSPNDPIPMLVYTHIPENDVRVKGKMKNYANIRHTKLSPHCLEDEFLNEQMKQQKLFPPYSPQYFTFIKEWLHGDSMKRRLSSHPDAFKDPIPMLLYTPN